MSVKRQFDIKCTVAVITIKFKKMKNLEQFKLSKNQMSRISGGRFDCHISDIGYVEHMGMIGGSYDMSYNDFPEGTTYEDVEQFIKKQIGENNYVACVEVY